MNIILIGMMGSGKSTIGVKLSEKLNMKLIDSDSKIEQSTNLSIKSIFENYGEEYFRKLEIETFLELSKLDNIIISTGGGSVLSDTLKPLIDSKFIYLKWNVDGLLLNLTNRIENRPLLGEKELEEKLNEIFSDRKDLYLKWSSYIVDCDGKTPENIVDEILNTVNFN